MIDGNYLKKKHKDEVKKELPRPTPVAEWFQNPKNNALDKIRRKLNEKIEDLIRKINDLFLGEKKDSNDKDLAYLKEDLELALYIRRNSIYGCNICSQCYGSGYDSNKLGSARCCSCYGIGRLFVIASPICYNFRIEGENYKVQRFLVRLIKEIMEEETKN